MGIEELVIWTLNIMKRILVVEDDTNLGTSLASMLEITGYEVAYISDGNKTIEAFEQFKPNAIVLDVMLNATLDGFELAKLIRLKNDTPILFTTSLYANEDLRQGFSITMSDYVHKPYNVMEICLRLDSLLQRANQAALPTTKTGMYQLASYSINFSENIMWYADQKIRITQLESKFLKLLIKNQHRFMSKDEVVRELWKSENPLSKSDCLNTLCTALRRYFAPDGLVKIENKKGLGLRLKITPSASVDK